MPRAALLQPDHVLHRDAGEHRDLVAAQPGRPPRTAVRHAHVLGAHPAAPCAQRRAQQVVIHLSSLARRRGAVVVPAVPPPSGPVRRPRAGTGSTT
jgi:hypothetical protein